MMDELIVDHLEGVISGSMQGSRLAKSLPVLCGCLGGAELPEHIREKLAILARQVLLQDVFDSLVNSLNQLNKSVPRFSPEPSQRDHQVMPSPGLERLLDQIEQARVALSSCDVSNQSEIIGWIVAQAKGQKLWGRTRRR